MRTTILFAGIICIILASSFFIYQKETKALNKASELISSINLKYYTQRGMAYNKPVQLAKVETLENYNEELSSADNLFEKAPKSALAAYELILSKDPANSKTHLHLGILYLKMKQLEAAKEHLFFVYEDKESTWKADAGWFLSLIFLMENNPEKAEFYIRKSLEENTNYKADAEKLLSLFS